MAYTISHDLKIISCFISFVKCGANFYILIIGALSIHLKTSNNLVDRQRKDHKRVTLHIDFIKAFSCRINRCIKEMKTIDF